MKHAEAANGTPSVELKVRSFVKFVAALAGVVAALLSIAPDLSALLEPVEVNLPALPAVGLRELLLMALAGFLAAGLFVWFRSLVTSGNSPPTLGRLALLVVGGSLALILLTALAGVDVGGPQLVRFTRESGLDDGVYNILGWEGDEVVLLPCDEPTETVRVRKSVIITVRSASVVIGPRTTPIGYFPACPPGQVVERP